MIKQKISSLQGEEHKLSLFLLCENPCFLHLYPGAPNIFLKLLEKLICVSLSTILIKIVGKNL